MLTPRLDILPLAQQSLWPQLIDLPDHFVLYGGTAIALRLGHRESVDFDFFSDVPLDETQKDRLLSDVNWLVGANVLQSDRNTLTVSVKHAGDSIKLSFFGGMRTGRVGTPDMTDDAVLWVASLDDLLAHKLKVVHDRAEGRDYQDIAVMLEHGQSLERGLAAMDALFGSNVPAMITLKALTFFDDINEGERLTEHMKSVLLKASRNLGRQLDPVEIISRSLR
jgi:hypothetical protein